MSYKAAIFDLDGTLLNTLEDLKDAVNHCLEKFGYPTRNSEQIMASLGNGARNLITTSLPEGTAKETIDEILAYYEPYYQAHCQIKTAPFPGIMEMMEQLKAQGIRMAIVSNKGDGAVKTLAPQYFGDLVEAAVGERAGIRRKPQPDSVLQAMKELKINPEEAIYVGDSEVDAQTAVNAGLDCALVSWGFRSRAQLEVEPAKAIVDSAEELERVIHDNQASREV